MTAVATSTAATATAYSNQRKIDRCQNGVLWAMFWDGTSTTGTSLDFYYSTDDGATWTKGGEFGFAGTGTSYTPNASLFIDLDDYAHVVYKDRHDGYIYYRRGTPNAGRTAWTWSSATVVRGDTQGDYPDIVVHREGTGWAAHIVMSFGTASANSSAVYYRAIIDSGGSVTVGNLSQTTAGGTSNPTFPSIEFNHTGDGKTVAGSTPHLYVAWSAGATGAGLGIRFKKATYSGGSWTWGTEREIDSTRYWTVHAGQTMFDGTRVVIAVPMATEGANDDVVIYERDAADTTTTTRILVDNAATTERLFLGSASYDGAGNVYLLGRNHDEAAGTYDLVYRKWTRETTTLGPEVVIDAGVGEPYVSAKRGYSNSRIEFVYTDGTASPYNITYESILLNYSPNVPTNLQVTSDVLDTTPVFSADVSDPDTTQQIKGRFTIYQSDGTTVVGTIDSALTAGAHTATAEYASALPVGNYKVAAATVDDVGAVSAQTSQVSFSIKQTVETDEQFIWDVDALIVVNRQLIWDVLVANQKDIQLIWNTTEQAEVNVSLEWVTKPVWTVVDPDPENNPVTWEKVSP